MDGLLALQPQPRRLIGLPQEVFRCVPGTGSAVLEVQRWHVGPGDDHPFRAGPAHDCRRMPLAHRLHVVRGVEVIRDGAADRAEPVRQIRFARLELAQLSHSARPLRRSLAGPMTPRWTSQLLKSHFAWPEEGEAELSLPWRQSNSIDASCKGERADVEPTHSRCGDASSPALGRRGSSDTQSPDSRG